jgi:hypothetical protein
MILLFNKLPVTLDSKLNKMLEIAKAELGSEFSNVQGSRWLGDNLTPEAVFPRWIIKEAEDNPSEVLIVQIIKSFHRWLFDLERGYGAAVPWETIHVPHKIPDKILLGLADLYFPRYDMSSQNFSEILLNLKTFSIKAEENYFRKKGTPDAIRYLLITLLGIPYNACEVVIGSPGFLIVRASVDEKYKDFLNKCVYPAGMTVLYESV